MPNTNAIVQTTPSSIQHPVEIDELLVNIAAIDAQIEHYEALKKHRNSVIDAEIDKLEGNKAQYREAIQQFMASNGEKTLNYPGVGKVTRKAGTRKWIVKDEDALISYLKANPGLSPQLLAKVVVTEEKVVKKELNKILDDLNAHNALQTDTVELEASKESLSISFDKGDSLLTAARDRKADMLSYQPAATPQTPSQPAPSSTASYDALEI